MNASFLIFVSRRQRWHCLTDRPTRNGGA